MKKLFSLLLCGAMMFSLVACEKDPVTDVSSEASSIKDETSSEAVSMGFVMPTANTYEEITYPLVEAADYFHVTGRTAVTTTTFETEEQSGLLFDHAAQGLLFNADCEGDVTLTLALMLKGGSGLGDHFYTVYIDGVKQEKITVQGIYNGETIVNLPIAKDLPRGKHTFEVYRNHESLRGISTLISVTMNGVPEKWVEDENKLKIEFLGDSITSGLGVTATKGASDEGDIKYSDATLSYAFIASRILGAEASIVSRSGMTVNASRPENMYNYYNNLSYERDKTLTYDNTKMDVDLYVVALGTNDVGEQNKYTNEQIAESVKAALTAIRKDHPDTKILWVYGQLGTSRKTVISNAIEEMGGEAAGYYFYFCLKNDLSGGLNHPNAEAQQRHGEEVADYIKTILN